MRGRAWRDISIICSWLVNIEDLLLAPAIYQDRRKWHATCIVFIPWDMPGYATMQFDFFADRPTLP